MTVDWIIFVGGKDGEDPVVGAVVVVVVDGVGENDVVDWVVVMVVLLLIFEVLATLLVELGLLPVFVSAVLVVMVDTGGTCNNELLSPIDSIFVTC